MEVEKIWINDPQHESLVTALAQQIGWHNNSTPANVQAIRGFLKSHVVMIDLFQHKIANLRDPQSSGKARSQICPISIYIPILSHYRLSP